MELWEAMNKTLEQVQKTVREQSKGTRIERIINALYDKIEAIEAVNLESQAHTWERNRAIIKGLALALAIIKEVK